MTTNLELAKQYQEAYDWLVENLYSYETVPAHTLELAGLTPRDCHFTVHDEAFRKMVMGGLVKRHKGPIVSTDRGVQFYARWDNTLRDWLIELEFDIDLMRVEGLRYNYETRELTLSLFKYEHECYGVYARDENGVPITTRRVWPLLSFDRDLPKIGY